MATPDLAWCPADANRRRCGLPPRREVIVAGGAALDLSGWRKIAAALFDFERWCASVLVEADGRRLVIVKGSPESIFAFCGRLERGDGATGPLDGKARVARRPPGGHGVGPASDDGCCRWRASACAGGVAIGTFFAQRLGRLREADADALARLDFGAQARKRPVGPIRDRFHQ